jgi:hypothetical protein
MAAMGHVDPMFEFEAPRYIDFATGVENETEDVWFGMLSCYLRRLHAYV